jgi:hypothetical protein
MTLETWPSQETSCTFVSFVVSAFAGDIRRVKAITTKDTKDHEGNRLAQCSMPPETVTKCLTQDCITAC